MAQTLNSWIPAVIQGVTPWISTEDIEKGREWWFQIKQQLSLSSYGIICITPDNVNSPWLNFEAGALLANHNSPPIATFTLGLEPKDIPGPLRIFQGTKYTKEDIWRLVKDINKQRKSNQAPERALETAFQYAFPDLERNLNALLEKMNQDTKNAQQEETDQTIQQSETFEISLTQEEVRILSFFGKNPDVIPLNTVVSLLGINETKAEFYITELVDKGLLDVAHNYVSGSRYFLTQEGRRFLIQNGHVK